MKMVLLVKTDGNKKAQQLAIDPSWVLLLVVETDVDTGGAIQLLRQTSGATDSSEWRGHCTR